MIEYMLNRALISGWMGVRPSLLNLPLILIQTRQTITSVSQLWKTVQAGFRLP